MLARVLLWALAPVPANLVDAYPAVLAGRWACIALVDVLFAGLSGEERRAGADEVGLDDRALAAVSTWV